MRYAELKNIWCEDLAGLSGAAIGRVYAERATEVLVPRSADPDLYADRGVIDLDRAKELIGCKRSTLYQNRAVRAMIVHLEQRDLESKPSTSAAPQNAAGSTNVVTFPIEKTRQPSRYERGKIVVADLMLPYKTGVERRFQIPTLFWVGAVDYEVSDYMRALAVEEGRPFSTLLEYLKIIREFRRFCRAGGILGSLVCDDVLRAYQATKLNKGVQSRRINTVLGVIFQFYAWQERSGRLRDRVQLHNRPDYPEEMRHHPFAIGSKEFTTKDGKKIRVSNLWIDDSTRYPNRPTPNDDAIELVYDTQEGRHEERNTLTFSFARNMASRSFETLQVSVAQLPTREQLDRIFDGSLSWSFTVTRKGQRQGKLYPTPDLLLRILNYVEFHRSKIVQACKDAGRFVSNKLFLTDQGTPLSVGTLGEIARKAFKKADVLGSYHRLRAARAQEEVERALDAVDVGDVELGPETLWKHSILMRAADFLDHRSLRSLEFYLNDLINSRVQKSTGAKLHVVEEALAERTRTLAEVEKRLRRASGLWRADPVLAEFIHTGDLKNPSLDDRRRLKELREELELFEANYAEAA